MWCALCCFVLFWGLVKFDLWFGAGCYSCLLIAGWCLLLGRFVDCCMFWVLLLLLLCWSVCVSVVMICWIGICVCGLFSLVGVICLWIGLLWFGECWLFSDYLLDCDFDYWFVFVVIECCLFWLFGVSVYGVDNAVCFSSYLFSWFCVTLCCLVGCVLQLDCCLRVVLTDN